MVKDRWDDRLAIIALDVVSKQDFSDNVSTTASKHNYFSGVTNASTSGVNDEGIGDTCSSLDPYQPVEEHVQIDWATLTIMVDPVEDGVAKAIVYEERVYEAMGFKAADKRAEAAATEAVPIPSMLANMQRDFVDAVIPVDDIVEEEPLHDWDRENLTC
jgi:hypothetical protein